MAEAAAETPTATPTETPPENTPAPASSPAPSSQPNGSEAAPERTTIAQAPVDDTPSDIPAAWREDWRDAFAGSNKDDLKMLNRYKDPSGVWKAFKSLRSKMDGGEYKRRMPEGDDEEAIKQWRAEAGIPETADAYLENLPQDLQVEEDDKPYLDAYFKQMHARGVPVEDAQAGLQAYYEIQASEIEQRLEQDRVNQQRFEDELRSEWGPEYRANMNSIHNLLDTHGPEGLKEALFAARLEDGTPLGDFPPFLQLLAGVSREINPYGTVTPIVGQSASQTIADEIRQLEKESADTKGREFDYWSNPGKQQRLRELYEMQERMGR